MSGGCADDAAAEDRRRHGQHGGADGADVAKPRRTPLVAELHGYDGWLLGCRDGGLRQGRRQITVTPLEVLGTPSGTIGTALMAASALRCEDYVLAGDAP